MEMTELSRYFSDDRLKEAVVCLEDSNYIVRFYQNGKLVGEQRDLIGRSEYYAEEVAENYVLDILKLDN